MSNSTPLHMADIFELETTASLPVELSLVIALIIVLVLLSVIYSIRYFSPLNTIRRAVITSKYSPRQGAHQLAQLMRAGVVNADDNVIAELNRLRFSHKEPDTGQIMKLLNKVHKHA